MPDPRPLTDDDRAEIVAYLDGELDPAGRQRVEARLNRDPRARTEPPAARLHQEELAAVVRQALAGLNERQRVAVVLNKFEDMNYAEIAEVMGLTTKAVKSLLSRARENLRQTLKDYIYMDGEPVPASPDEE